MKYFQKIMRRDKERFTVPRSVQQTIPIQRIWQDGLFYSGSRYSQAWRFSDINYLLSGRAEKEQKFHIYSALLNAQKSGCYAQITICNHSLDRNQFAASVLLPEREDGRGRYRDEYNQFLLEQAIGEDTIVQERYVTISDRFKTPEDARLGLGRAGADLMGHFSRLVPGANPWTPDSGLRPFAPSSSRIALYPPLMLQTHEKRPRFRDYLCPMSLSIKGGYFEMDGKFGRVLFLRSYANFINDELISDLAALPRNLMLTIGFIPVPTDEAVKELQNKLLSAETNIAQWQRKQNQANNFSSVIPYDMEQQRTETTEFLNDLSARDQRMLFTLVSIVHLADSKGQLDQDTETLQAKASGTCANWASCGISSCPACKPPCPSGYGAFMPCGR